MIFDRASEENTPAGCRWVASYNQRPRRNSPRDQPVASEVACERAGGGAGGGILRDAGRRPQARVYAPMTWTAIFRSRGPSSSARMRP
jgi:hypothetical protein